jgi:putative salt-induced outer membrane protein YdiY
MALSLWKISSIWICGLGLAVADTITLTNGDRLQGTVVSEDGERVVFQSPLLPQSMEIPRSAVSEVSRTRSVTTSSSQSDKKQASSNNTTKAKAESPRLAPVAAKKESPAPKKTFFKLPENWKGRLGVGYSDRKNDKSDTTELSANGKLAYETKKNEAEWKAHYQYRSEEDKTSNDRYGISQRVRHRGKELLYVQAETKAEVDHVTKKRTEVSQTVGVGYSPVKEKEFAVNFTPGFKAEMITDAEREDQHGKAYKAHVQQDLKWKMTDSVSLGQGLSYSLDPRDSANWDLDFNAYVETALSEDVNVRLNYTREFLNQSNGSDDKESSQVGAALVWGF